MHSSPLGKSEHCRTELTGWLIIVIVVDRRRLVPIPAAKRQGVSGHSRKEQDELENRARIEIDDNFEKLHRTELHGDGKDGFGDKRR